MRLQDTIKPFESEIHAEGGKVTISVPKDLENIKLKMDGLSEEFVARIRQAFKLRLHMELERKAISIVNKAAKHNHLDEFNFVLRSALGDIYRDEHKLKLCLIWSERKCKGKWRNINQTA